MSAVLGYRWSCHERITFEFVELSNVTKTSQYFQSLVYYYHYYY